MKPELLLVGLVAAPALGALARAVLGASRDRLAHGLALASACLTAAFGWGIVRALAASPFALELRVPLAGGVVFALGADATTLPGLATVALTAPVALMLARRERAGAPMLGLVASALLALSSLDGLLTLVGLVASVSLVLVHARRAGVDQRVRTRFALVAGLGVGAFAVALALLRGGAGDLASPWLAPELARVPWLARHAVVLGLPVVTTAWSATFVAAAALGGLAPFHLATSALLDERRPALALGVGVVFLRLGPALLIRWALPILPEGTRWAAPIVLDWAVAAAVIAAASAHGRRPLAGAVAFANAGVFAAAGALDAQGLGALVLHGAASAAALTLALALDARGRVARFLVAGGAAVGAVLVLTGVAARAPLLAAVYALALVVVSAPVGAPSADVGLRSRVLTAFAALALVLLAAGAVDRIAPGVRALGERLERAGGDGAGS